MSLSCVWKVSRQIWRYDLLRKLRYLDIGPDRDGVRQLKTLGLSMASLEDDIKSGKLVPLKSSRNRLKAVYNPSEAVEHRGDFCELLGPTYGDGLVSVQWRDGTLGKVPRKYLLRYA